MRLAKWLGTVLLTIIVAASMSAQSADRKISLANKKTAEMVEFYKQGKFKKALSSAKVAYKIFLEVYGEENLATGIAAKNLADVHVARRDHKDAAQFLRIALKAFETEPVRNGSRILATLRSLGTSLAINGKVAEAVDSFREARKFAVSNYGTQSEEMLSVLKNETEFQAYMNNLPRAEQLFFERYKLASELDGQENQNRAKVMSDFSCYCYTYFPDDYGSRYSAFIEETKEYRTERPVTYFEDQGSVVNGRAISLPYPKYSLTTLHDIPDLAVLVTIVIGKDGLVKSAKARCGTPFLREITEKAALRARFEPTLLNGKPVEVQGIIIYRFHKR